MAPVLGLGLPTSGFQVSRAALAQLDQPDAGTASGTGASGGHGGAAPRLQEPPQSLGRPRGAPRQHQNCLPPQDPQFNHEIASVLICSRKSNDMYTYAFMHLCHPPPRTNRDMKERTKKHILFKPVLVLPVLHFFVCFL